MPKCQSHCRKREQGNCRKTFRCVYTDGEKRKYCGLSRKYRMNKKSCAITRRLTRADAARRIQAAVRKTRKNKTTLAKPSTSTKGPSTLEIQEFNNRVQARRLARFMRNVEPKRRAAFLKGVCSDAGVCIAFGKETAKIRKHFDGFTSFEYLTGKVKRIGTVSSNGFVKMLTYSRNGYEAHAVLKSTVSSEADNLYYEYLVGKYINRLAIQYPCFVETYGLLKYKTEAAYVEARDNRQSSISLLKSDLIPIRAPTSPDVFAHSCENPKNIAILVENIKSSLTLMEMISNNHTFSKQELHYALYHVYMPLAALSESFTHYDLHPDNVIVNFPIKNNYVQYHYHLPGDQVVSFKSSYFVKIIDYGRAFFNDEANPGVDGSSKRIYDQLCSTPECQKCGKNVGFYWLDARKLTEKEYYMSAQIHNQSHDLRLLNMLVNPGKKKNPDEIITEHNPDLFDIIKKVKYQLVYGTEEKTKSGLPKHIQNVSDAAKSLEAFIRKPSTVAENEKHYANRVKLGDMHIYYDGRPLEFHTA